MSDVKLLREAAKKMRERAEAATPSPWGVGNDTNVARGVEVTGPGSYTCIQSVADVDDDRCDWDRDEAVEVSPEYDAEYIASMHPAVALGISDLLAKVALAAPIDGSEPPRNPRDRAVVYAALALAHAYLGGE